MPAAPTAVGTLMDSAPFARRAVRQVLGPDSRVGGAFHELGSRAKGMEVEMSVASGRSRLLGEPRPGPPRLATPELPSGLKPGPQFCQL